MRVLSVVGMGGLVLGILVWQEGGEIGRPRSWRSAPSPSGRSPGGSCAASATAKRRCIDPDLFRHPNFTAGISGVMLQNVSLGGAMIALPLFLQMTLEYNAMQAGLSLAPLSLTMFAVAMLGREEGRRPAAGRHHPRRLRC